MAVRRELNHKLRLHERT